MRILQALSISQMIDALVAVSASSLMKLHELFAKAKHFVLRSVNYIIYTCVYIYKISLSTEIKLFPKVLYASPRLWGSADP